MSFSRRVKEELVQQLCEARHCLIAEFAAIFALIGKIKQSKVHGVSLQIQTENLTVAKKSYILLRKTFQVQVEVRVRSHHTKVSGVNYLLIVREDEDIRRILEAVKVLDVQTNQWGDLHTIHPLVVQNTCCKRSYLRGTFLVAGSITNPEKAYHLEMAVPSEQYALQLKELMSAFSLEGKIVMRKKNYVLYLKEGAQIVDFLNVIEAHMALMELENVRIVKEVRNSVNRQVNCETANISKTVTAAAKQIEDIKYLQCKMGFSRLTDALREVAELRLDYPDSSLQELGQMLENPISKSGVNHRLRKISEIAEQLRGKDCSLELKEDMKE